MSKKQNYISGAFSKTIGLLQRSAFLKKVKGIMYYIDGGLLAFVKRPKVGNSSRKKRVLVVYNLAFGDGVIFRCSLGALRKVFPRKGYEITLLCQKGINKLYENDGVFDKIIPIDFNRATLSLGERLRNFRTVREKYYDIIVDPVGVMEWNTNVLYTRAACGDKKIGLMDREIDCGMSERAVRKIYDETIDVDSRNISLIDYYNNFIEKLGAGKVETKPGLTKLKAKKTKIKLPKDYFIIFPCASVELKRWPTERYAELANRIYEKTGFKMVLVGTQVDKKSIEDFKKLVDIPCLDLVEKTSLDDYIDIIRRAKLIVTNDTSAYHIAVVEETPVVIITGAYTYDKYVKYEFKGCENYRRPYIVCIEKKCKNCLNRCPYLESGEKTWPCLDEISVDYAWGVVNKLIEDNKYGGKNGYRKA